MNADANSQPWTATGVVDPRSLPRLRASRDGAWRRRRRRPRSGPLSSRVRPRCLSGTSRSTVRSRSAAGHRFLLGSNGFFGKRAAREWARAVGTAWARGRGFVGVECRLLTLPLTEPISSRSRSRAGFRSTERRRNRTFQAEGCSAPTALKAAWATRPLPLHRPDATRRDASPAVGRELFAQPAGEVERGHRESLVEVETVGVGALRAEPRLEGPAAEPYGLLVEPPHQPAHEPQPPRARRCGEFVHIEVEASGEVVSGAEARHRGGPTAPRRQRRDETIALRPLLPVHPLDESLAALELATQLPHRFEGEHCLVRRQLPYSKSLTRASRAPARP